MLKLFCDEKNKYIIRNFRNYNRNLVNRGNL